MIPSLLLVLLMVMMTARTMRPLWRCRRLWFAQLFIRIFLLLLLPLLSWVSEICRVDKCKLISILWSDRWSRLVALSRGNFPFPNYKIYYPGAVWWSLPGPCPSKNYTQWTDWCKEREPGGYCDQTPTGQGNCTWTYQDAGEITIDLWPLHFYFILFYIFIFLIISFCLSLLIFFVYFSLTVYSIFSF